jgi:single stranded DNA-binding protein
LKTEKSLNRVLVSGVLRDARLGSTPTGKQVCNFTLIISESSSDGDKQYKTYLPVVAWQGLGKRAAELPLNQKIRVTGKLAVRSWEDKEGKGKRYKTEIVADSVEPVARLDLPPDQSAIDRRPISDEDIPF